MFVIVIDFPSLEVIFTILVNLLKQDNGVHLVYYNQDKQQQPQPNRPFTVVVPLREQYWQRVDGAPATREHFMMALAELQNILIKATYTTNTQEAA